SVVGLVLAWGLAAMVGPRAMAGDPPGPGGSEGERLIWPGQPPHSHDHFGDGAGKIGGPVGHMARVTPHKNSVIANGPLTYGPPGVFPGFYGFGLAFHRRYCYRCHMPVVGTARGPTS